MLTNVPLLYTFCSVKTMREQPKVTSGSTAAERKRIYQRLASGELQRVMSGVMAEADALLTDEQIMAIIHTKQPAAVMNLVSALSHHNMTTQIPDTLSVALPRGVRMPRVYATQVQVWYTTPNLLKDCATEVHSAYGNYLVTTPERTLVDCFKYRNKIGLSVFLEAAHMSIGKLNPSLIHFEAERLRVLNYILPYLKSYFA